MMPLMGFLLLYIFFPDKHMKKLILLLLLLFPGLSMADDFSEYELEEDSSFIEKADSSYDPLERMNRITFGFNQMADGVLLFPVVGYYKENFPELGQRGVNNFINNLGEPIYVVNWVLMQDGRKSFSSFWRFIINSSFGIGGVFDPASNIGLEKNDIGFGAVMGYYNIGAGPYLVLPLLGPSSFRDATGMIADGLMDPFYYMLEDEARATIIALTIIDRKSSVINLQKQLNKNALDSYALYRNMHMQLSSGKIKQLKLEYK